MLVNNKSPRATRARICEFSVEAYAILLVELPRPPCTRKDKGSAENTDRVWQIRKTGPRARHKCNKNNPFTSTRHGQLRRQTRTYTPTHNWYKIFGVRCLRS